MRDTLATLTKPWEIECGILDLNLNESEVTHWTCWIVKNNECFYFDSSALISLKRRI